MSIREFVMCVKEFIQCVRQKRAADSGFAYDQEADFAYDKAKASSYVWLVHDCLLYAYLAHRRWDEQATLIAVEEIERRLDRIESGEQRPGEFSEPRLPERAAFSFTAPSRDPNEIK